MDRKKLQQYLVSLILIIFLTSLLANKFYWYYSIWYFDMIMHFLGGFWVGLLALYFLISPRLSTGTVLKILLVILGVGLGWEIFEILVDKALAENPFNLPDTVSDIFFDLAGGMVAIVYYFKKTADA